ncbi:MAG TPA: Sec-independent protein translocase TatB [Plantibacter sp.]|uniref:Sec-independent protein translocase TatB n=1 Tax=unclassified Plantibacter TaxID=2624265 RepID=UPI002CB13897|nr:Sec-independent protein translocase TatB [Plantibacter sp.]
MFGLTIDKLLVIAVLAAFLIGPDRLPAAAASLARLVRGLKELATGARERVREEIGPEFDDVDWQKLDPRQYDPRRIIRDALLDDESPPSATTSTLNRPTATAPQPDLET